MCGVVLAVVLTAAPVAVIHAQGGTSYGDDGIFHGQPTSSIPEPSTLVLLGAGLGLLARKLRRSHKSRG
jgi:hypothetical protein